MRQLQAIILVGGEGTRLRPLTFYQPKQMLPMCNMTMIERVIRHLAVHGVTQAVLSLGYKPEPFLKAFPDNEIAGVKLSYVVEPELLDTAGAIRFAYEKAGLNEPFIAINGDVFSDINLTEFVNFHFETNCDATIALTQVSDPSRYGVAVLDEKSKITAFVEKPSKETAPSNLINAGYYVINPGVIQLIDPTRRVSIEKEIFPHLAAKQALAGFVSKSYWIDTGTPESYLKAAIDILGKNSADVMIPEASLIKDHIYFGKDVFCEAQLSGRILIGTNSVVKKAVIKDAVIGSGVRIEDNAEIENSYIFDDVEIFEGAKISDSIIGKGSKIGANAVMKKTVVGFNVEVSPNSYNQEQRIN